MPDDPRPEFDLGFDAEGDAALDQVLGYPLLGYPPRRVPLGPPVEVGERWLKDLGLTERLRVMAVCRDWRRLLHESYELWHTISLGEVSACTSPAALAYGGPSGLPAGVPKLRDVDMNRLLTMSHTLLRELTLVSLSISSHAFYSLRTNSSLTSLTIVDCPQVDDNIAMAVPSSVHTLALLRCNGITARVAVPLPPTLSTLRLVGSSLRRQDMPLLRSASGMSVDVCVCANCESVAHEATMTRCQRCTVVGCTYSTVEVDPKLVKWVDRGCSNVTRCEGCDAGALCSDCDGRKMCQWCESPFCESCEDQVESCPLCHEDNICPNCPAKRCSSCAKVSCQCCHENGDGGGIYTCEHCDRAFCLECDPTMNCEICGRELCADEFTVCSCGTKSNICKQCLPCDRGSLSSGNPSSVAMGLCSSHDCQNLVCDHCRTACAGCAFSFCADCADRVDNYSVPHIVMDRAALRRVGIVRPTICGECDDMWCAECAVVLTCDWCGLPSCEVGRGNNCGRVQRCDGCDGLVCRFCSEVDRTAASCCSATAGWHGETSSLAIARSDLLPKCYGAASWAADSSRPHWTSVTSGRVTLLIRLVEEDTLRVRAPSLGFVDVVVERQRPSHGRLNVRRSEWVVAARLPVNDLNQFTAYRTDEWRVRLLGAPNDEEVRIKLIPPAGNLWQWRVGSHGYPWDHF